MSYEWPLGLANAWHPIAYSNELGKAPLAVKLMDLPLVLFRGREGLSLLEDVCPHRNAPLSAGRVVAGEIECPYHGWRFNQQGACTKVPGSCDTAKAGVKSFAVAEDGGLIWACLADTPQERPTLPPELGMATYDSFWWQIPASRASVGDAIENVLDPIHSYFLHPGLVRRTRNPQAVEMDFIRNAAGATARYIEPRAGLTLLQKLTEGNRVASFGRYCAPTFVQVGFEDQHGPHALISAFFTPVGQHETRPYACFSTRKGWLPAWLKRLFLIAFHKPVIAQDRAMLLMQSCQSEKFGGPHYHNGPVDLFGPVVWAGLMGVELEPMHQKLYLSDNDAPFIRNTHSR